MSLAKCPYCAEDIQEEALKCKHCSSWLTGDPVLGPHANPWSETDNPLTSMSATLSKKLQRSTSDKMFAGICGGLAHYVGIDSTIVRIAIAILAIMTGIFPGILTYLVLVFVIPRDNASAY